jgi:SAM-dependent methyltransferase
MRDPYDDRPYTDNAYAETHPSRIAAVARLAGWEAARVQNARILELGCGRGGNLLPMAAGLPGASFVGVDRSGRQIAGARSVAASTGLQNATFVHAAFETVDLAGASFDYVICHGVLSWIPASERSVLFGRIERSLSPGGVAHLSFNVLPGWYERLAARDWLRFAASSLERPATDAVASLRWLRTQISPEHADYRRRLEAVERRLAETDPAYAAHEYLADEHHPLSIRTFLNETTAAGLSYLGDAIPSTTALELLSDDARKACLALDTAGREQLVDFVRCTAFRRALLVRTEDAKAKSWSAPAGLDRNALQSLRIASRFRTRGPIEAERPIETFDDGDTAVQVSDLSVRRALHELAKAAPEALRFEDLTTRLSGTDGKSAPGALAAELFDVWLATASLDVLAAPTVFSTVAGERPVACPLARWQAGHGGAVTNRLHQAVLTPDAFVRWVLERLDGSRTRGDLTREARSLDGLGAVSDPELRELVAVTVDRLVACALVIA